MPSANTTDEPGVGFWTAISGSSPHAHPNRLGALRRHRHAGAD